MTTGDDTIRVMLARLEGKVDAALAVQGSKVERHEVNLADHEIRLRNVEGRSTVSPRMLWTTLTSAAVTLAALSPFVANLYGVAH